MNNERGYGVSLSRNQMAVGLMLGYVALQSLVPLFVAYGAEGSPFAFNAAWRVGGLIGYAVILLALFRREVFSGEVWKVVWSRAVSLAMLLWVVGSLDLAVYAWSTQYIEVAVATALFETWPIFFVILAGWLFRTEARYRKITAKTIFLFGTAFLGIVSVIASQAGGIGAFVSADARGGGGKSCDRRRLGAWRGILGYFACVRIQMGSRPRLGVVPQP